MNIEYVEKCPRCNGVSVQPYQILSDILKSRKMWKIDCSECALSMIMDDRQSLIKAWNSRPVENALQAHIKELDGLVQQAVNGAINPRLLVEKLKLVRERQP